MSQRRACVRELGRRLALGSDASSRRGHRARDGTWRPARPWRGAVASLPSSQGGGKRVTALAPCANCVCSSHLSSLASERAESRLPAAAVGANERLKLEVVRGDPTAFCRVARLAVHAPAKCDEEVIEGRRELVLRIGPLRPLALRTECLRHHFDAFNPSLLVRHAGRPLTKLPLASFHHRRELGEELRHVGSHLHDVGPNACIGFIVRGREWRRRGWRWWLLAPAASFQAEQKSEHEKTKRGPPKHTARVRDSPASRNA